jgi:hypothetical protein
MCHDFCLSRKLYVPRAKPGEKPVPNEDITHLVLSGWCGGRIRITTPEHEELFLQAYAADVFREKHYLAHVERKTDYFKFFMDLDIKETPEHGPTTIEDVNHLVSIALSAVSEFVERPGLTAFVCTSPPAVSAKCVKTGVHLHVPDMVVDSHMARMIRQLIVETAHKAGPSRHSNDYEDIFDEVVYFANGLRMIGSSKFSPCAECKSKLRDRDTPCCESCGGSGKQQDMYETKDECDNVLCVPRTYALSQVLTESEGQWTQDEEKLAYYEARDLKRFSKLVQLLSVRTPQTACSDFIHVPHCASMVKPAASNGRQSASKPKVLSHFTEDVTGLNKYVNNFYDVTDSTVLGLLKQLLTKVIIPHDERRTGMIMKKARGSGSGCYVIIPGGPGSTVCGNMPGDGMHRSNSVYFVVTTHGVTQKCFCTCVGEDIKAQRVTGVLCKDFKSASIVIPSDLKALLFPLQHVKSDRTRLVTDGSRAANRASKRSIYQGLGLAVQQALTRGPAAKRIKNSLESVM